MRDLTRLASRIVMFFMQFYYRLARHSRVSYKAYIDGRTRLTGYNTIQDNVLLAGARIGRGTYICRGSNFTDAEVGAYLRIYSPGFFLSQRATGVFVCPGKTV